MRSPSDPLAAMRGLLLRRGKVGEGVEGPTYKGRKERGGGLLLWETEERKGRREGTERGKENSRKVKVSRINTVNHQIRHFKMSTRGWQASVGRRLPILIKQLVEIVTVVHACL